ncbi:MAG: pyridoxamine 5'-phosphate oxidase family protein [Bacteroidota bacterium]
MKDYHTILETIDSRIIRFIKKHHTMALATSGNNIPWCCSCFYVYDEKENKFIITSDNDTRHVSEFLVQPDVSGTIALETLIVGKIQGVQFSGTVKKNKGKEAEHAKTAYIKRFPVAAFSELTLWSIEINYIKFTHNQLGFGKKLIWKKKN